MEKQDFKTALELLKQTSEKRKFTQGVDLIINLKNLDLKKNEQQIDIYTQLHFGRGRKTKIACLCGPELLPNAKQNCDLAISTDDFARYAQDKKAVKKLAVEYDFFIAQANIMPEVAKTFGRVLGPKGKMPNPKAGAVVPPNANLKPLVDKLAKTVRLTARTQMSIKINIGKESMPDAEILDNAFVIYDSLIKVFPQETNNVKDVLLKFSMSKPIPVGMTGEEVKALWADQEKRRAEAAALKKKQAEMNSFKPKKQKVEVKEADDTEKAPETSEEPAGDEAKPKKKRVSKKKAEEAA